MNDGLNNNNNDFNNIEQNEYYNNDSYYTNSNYDDNYSDTTYEEKEKKTGIWWKILVVILFILVIIFLLLKFCGSGKKSKDQLYAELTAKICTAAENYVANNPSVLDRTEPGRSAIIKFQVLADSNLIEAQIANPYYDGSLFSDGTQPKYYSIDNSVRLSVMNDGTLNCELVDNANDVTAPELRLNGDAEITLAVGTDFEDPGYTATDDYDGDITDKVVRSGNVNSAEAGEYELTYTVQDSAGNVTTKKRKVIYDNYSDIEVTLGTILDGVTPQISLKGSNPYCMVKGTQYVEPGATATDNVDGNITNRIAVTNKVTGNLMGSFRVVYKVEDSSGNEAVAYRAVVVTTECPEEKEPEKVVNNRPTITLIGKNSVTINVGTQYIDLGATAYDKEDGDITSKLVTDATAVNVNSAGVYKVIYRVTDSQGLTASATRTVTVKQAVYGNPAVRFTEDKENLTVLIGQGNDTLLTPPKAVNENGVAVNVYTSIEDYETKQQVSSIDWNVTGKYRVIYTAVHGNGVLKQTKSIVITVENGVVTIGGKNAVNVILRTENCDINEADLVTGGVTFDVPGNKTPIVTLTGNVGNACKIGTYEVVVDAKVDNWDVTTKSITVYVVNGTPIPAPVGAPSKTTITGNSANPADVYNISGQWVGGAVTGITLTFEATPKEETEIAHFEWSSNCETPNEKISKLSSTTGLLTWTKEGTNNVCIRAVSTTNVEGPWSDPIKLNIDRTGPSASFTHTWADDKNDWHNSATLKLEYKAVDSESGLSHFEYTYDDVKAKKAEEIVTYNEGTGSLVVNENIEPTRPELFVYVRAVDKAGNKGEWTANPSYANIDTVKPNAPELTVEGDNTKLVKINAKFTDGESVRPSGFGKLIYTINDGTENTESTQIIRMPLNQTEVSVAQYVKVWAVDKAGNKSDFFTAKNVIVAPAGKPATGVTLKNNGKTIESGASCSNDNVYPGTKFTLVATPVPTDSDEKDVVWSVDNASIAVIDENGNVSAKSVGKATVTAKVGSVNTTCVLNVIAQVSSSGGSGGEDKESSSGGSYVPPKATTTTARVSCQCCYNTSSVAPSGYVKDGRCVCNQGYPGTCNNIASPSYTPTVGTTAKKTTKKTTTRNTNGCFLEGTKVLTIKGYVDINKIKLNDMVLSYNEINGKNEYKKVTNLYVHKNFEEELYTITSGDIVVEATSIHRFYIKTKYGNSWVEAKALQVGDEILDSNGIYHIITKITSKSIVNDVYNIEVEDNHNYYVTENAILVHNRKEDAPY